MELEDFFRENKRIALAFSGGADSAYLLYAAQKCGADVRAYYVRSAFQPQFEYEDAVRLADELHVKLTVLSLDVLSCREITDNTEERCYFCKRRILAAIKEQAEKDGYALLADGTNADDDADDRPGMRALRELAVRSPLRECGLTKQEIRRRSGEAGLFTWDKPAYACLATRIHADEPITKEKLAVTEQAETYLAELGFRNFRVRMRDGCAKLQFTEKDRERFLRNKDTVMAYLERYYRTVSLDDVTRLP